MRQYIVILIIAAAYLCGCIRSARPTASAIIVVTTNTADAISFIQSEVCEKQLAEAGTTIHKISATPYRDTTLIEIRVVAPTEKGAVTAAATAVTLLKERRAVSDKANAIEQMLNDPRNKTESPELNLKRATAVAEQHPQSSIQLVEGPRILK